jgi:hypothetical protein
VPTVIAEAACAAVWGCDYPLRRTTCRQLVVWQRSQPSMTVAVNLSVRQMLAPDIAGMIEGVLVRTGARRRPDQARRRRPPLADRLRSPTYAPTMQLRRPTTLATSHS